MLVLSHGWLCVGRPLCALGFHPSPSCCGAPGSLLPSCGGAAQISTRHFGTLRRFSVDELASAANGFDDDNLLGEGGFSKVYKGTLEDGTVVAIKRIRVRGARGRGCTFYSDLALCGHGLGNRWSATRLFSEDLA